MKPAAHLSRATPPGPGGKWRHSRRACPEPAERAGFVLVAVQVIVLLSSMVAISLLFRLKAEATATAASTGGEQAWAAAMSGIEQAILQAKEALPGTTDWQDAPAFCKEQLVYDDGSDGWYFTICSPVMDDALHDLRYGLTDEASKVNVNASHTTNLLHVPRMTAALVAGLRDFIDFDDMVRPDGAEQEYYSALPRPYVIRNAPLDTLDELLLVRDFTPALVYGEDANMNWRLDPNEQDGDERYPPDNHDSRLELGLRHLLTVTSYEPNKDNDGVPRANLNNETVRFPGGSLPAGLTNYLGALRTNKVQLQHPAELLEATATMKDPQGRQVAVGSGVNKENLPVVLDLFTCSSEPRFEGLLNVNTASIAALQSIPGVDEALAESIVSTRRSISPERRTTIAWLYQEGVVTVAQFKALAPYLTARSFQFSFHVVGYGLPSGRYRVLDVIIDMAGSKPRITYLREITRLGLPFRLENREGPSA